MDRRARSARFVLNAGQRGSTRTTVALHTARHLIP
jgi:hypothetical protein